jgi:hypothetical protein
MKGNGECATREAAWLASRSCAHSCNYMSTAFTSLTDATWSIRRHAHKSPSCEHECVQLRAAETILRNKQPLS